MADLIKRTPYERPSLPQRAPLGFVPLGLHDEIFSVISAGQLLNSFRTPDRPDPYRHTDFPQRAPLDFIQRVIPAATSTFAQQRSVFSTPPPIRGFNEWLTQPAFSWLAGALVFEENFTAALNQLSDSYRVRESLPVDRFERTSFPQTAPLSTVPVLAFAIELWPAIEQELHSFRSREGLPLDKFERTTFPQSAPLSFVDTLSVILSQASKQQLHSFRTHESLPLDRHKRTDFPQTAPLGTIQLGLLQDLFQTEFWSALQQELNSFRLRETLPLDKFARTDFPQGAPLFAEEVGLLVVPFDENRTPALIQSLGSFRIQERLPFDKFERTAFPQGTPLLTIELDLPRDLFEIEFTSAFDLQHAAFRTLATAELKSTHLTQPGFGWIGEANAITLPPGFLQVGPNTQLLGSFHLRPSLPLDRFERTSFPQSVPLFLDVLRLISTLRAESRSTTTVELSWTLGFTASGSIEVHRALGSVGIFSKIATVSSTTTTFSDSGLTPGTVYCYKLRVI